MGKMSFEEVLNLLKLLREAEEEDDEETIASICNVLPDEIQIWGDDILIKI